MRIETHTALVKTLNDAMGIAVGCNGLLSVPYIVT